MYSAKVDSANNTLYTANYDSTISAFDLSRCHAEDLAGCAGDTPGTVTSPQPGFETNTWLAVDPALNSAYVVYHKDDALFVVNANVCNGSRAPPARGRGARRPVASRTHFPRPSCRAPRDRLDPVNHPRSGRLTAQAWESRQ